MYQPIYHFCSNCGSNVALSDVEGDSIKRYYCSNCDTVHYTNPKLIVGVLPYYQDKVLLCRRAIEPRKNYWNIPAGFLENNELAEEGALREVWEEAEGRARIDGVLAIYSIPQANQVYIHFYGELIDGQFGIGVESLECKLFSEDEIPWEDMAFTSSTFALKKFFNDRKTGQIRTHIGSFKLTDR
jgi:ADP-ribose pyrophosphatase YjhB (NUDIX family)